MKKDNKNNEERINFLLSTELKKAFKHYCIEKNFNMSDRFRELIEKDVKGEIK